MNRTYKFESTRNNNSIALSHFSDRVYFECIHDLKNIVLN